MRVAIMQPYLLPYGGYWRLLTEADVFVILDCVQFPRRGRVHRCEIAPGRWLSLPVTKAPRSALIREMRIRDDARPLMEERLARLPFARAGDTPLRRDLLRLLTEAEGALVDVLEASLRLVAGALGARARILRSSTLEIGAAPRRAERLIEIALRLGATHYLNAPGGRALYAAEDFTARGLALEFLPDYSGQYRWMLPALFNTDPLTISQDIRLF